MADPPLDASTRLAVQRTRLAHERTLMAWIRTCTSLIAFGFTIFKFFQYLSTKEELRRAIVSPWVVGVLMILVGLIGLTLAWIQHRQAMKALQVEVGTMPYSISGIMAGFIAVVGIDRTNRCGLEAVTLRWNSLAGQHWRAVTGQTSQYIVMRLSRVS
jgi:putative membrane protein